MRNNLTIAGALSVLVGLAAAVAAEAAEPQVGAYAVKSQKGIEWGVSKQQADAGGDQAVAGGMVLDAFLPEDVQRPVPAVLMVADGEEPPARLARPAYWLASHGYAVFLLGDSAGYAELRQAVRYLRKNAKKHGLDPYRLGIWGFAEAGPLAVAIGLVDEDFGGPVPGAESEGGETGKTTEGAASAEMASGRVQAVVACSEEWTPDLWTGQHVSYEDPAVLVLKASDEEAVVGPMKTPKAFDDHGVTCRAYAIPAETPGRVLENTIVVAGTEKAGWELALQFLDDSLKMAPSNLVARLDRIVRRRVRAQDWVLGNRARTDLHLLFDRAVKRLGREPTAQEMKVAREHARKLADRLVRLAAPAGAAPRITRVIVAQAVSQLSPLWPFTSAKVPATVPPVGEN